MAMLKKTFWLGLILVFFTPSWAQQRDSLRQMINRGDKEIPALYASLNQAIRLSEKNPKAALKEVNKSLRLSFRYKDKRAEAYSYQTLGVIHKKLGNNEKARTYVVKSMPLFEEIKDLSGRYVSLKLSAQIEELAGEPQKAYDRYLEVLALAIALKKTEDIEIIKEQLGVTAYNSEQYNTALNYFRQLEVLYQSEQNTEKEQVILLNIGKCYTQLGDTLKAVSYFNKSEEITKKLDDDAAIQYYEEVGASYDKVGNSSKSIEYNKKALERNKSKGYTSKSAKNSLDIGWTYAFSNNAYEALPYLEEGVALSEQVGEIQETGEAYKVISEAYENLGMIDEALTSFKKYKSLQEEIIAKKKDELTKLKVDESAVMIQEKQISLLIKDKELDEQQIQLLEREQQVKADALSAQQQVNILLGGIIILLLIALFFFYRGIRKNKVANQLLAIRSLRTQMNPHFIFNALNSVNNFISKNDDYSANVYLTKFSQLMRKVLEHSKHDFVVLSDEVDTISNYLNIEHLRFADHFDYDLHVDEDLNTIDLSIPPMLIQPFIENAIWHGLRYKKEKGYLKVDMIAVDQRIKVVIEDNGIGRMASSALKTTHQQKAKSTAMYNTSERIRLLNEVHKIDITCSVEDLDKDGTGTKVTLTLPQKAISEE